MLRIPELIAKDAPATPPASQAVGDTIRVVRRTVRSFKSSFSSSALTTDALRMTRSRPVPLFTTSRSLFIAANLSAMDATMPNVKEEFAICRS